MTSKPNNASADNNGRQVPISDLTGAALTKAVRMWAKHNGHAVADRGAVSPDLILKAGLSGATVDPALLETSTVYVLTDKAGKAYTVRGRQGKATLDGLAESVGLDPEAVASVTRDGALFALPRRASSEGVAPWNVTYRAEDGTKARARYTSGRGRLNVANVAVALKIKPEAIVSVERDGVRYGVEVTYRFTKA